jgi:hypothetical protein
MLVACRKRCKMVRQQNVAFGVFAQMCTKKRR